MGTPRFHAASGVVLAFLAAALPSLADPTRSPLSPPPFGPPPLAPGTAVAPSAAASANRIPVARPQSIYETLPRCRVFSSEGKTIPVNALTTYVVSGTTGFEKQGGQAGGCGVPASATAVSLSLSTSRSGADGAVIIYPAGVASTALRSASILAQKTLTTETTATLGVDGKIRLKPSAAAAVEGTVAGYFAPPIAGLVSPGGAIYSGGARFVSATNPSAGVYQVKIDRDVTYCTPVVTPYNAGSGVYGVAYAFSGDTVVVYTWYISSTSHVETLYSFYFYLSVFCG